MKKTIVDLTYYSFPDRDPEKIMASCYSTLGFLEEISKNLNTFFLVRTESAFRPMSHNSIHVFFVKGSRLKKWQIPFHFNAFVKSLQPDYIVVHGFGSAHYLILLKLLCKNSKILLQCNGYAPKPSGLKKLAYKAADFFIDGYLFTGIENAAAWYEGGIFNQSKVFDVMEGSTHFKFDKDSVRKDKSYLWVANLFALKDPMTVLKAFDTFLNTEPEATLTMVYQETNLIEAVSDFISKSKNLKSAVKLQGFIPHADLEKVYNEHQYFISGSHQEGSGYALVEAMACGCIPIVTTIPSHRYMTDDCALLFRPGNDQELLNQLIHSQEIHFLNLQNEVLKQFKRKLSFKAIADKVQQIFHSL